MDQYLNKTLKALELNNIVSSAIKKSSEPYHSITSYLLNHPEQITELINEYFELPYEYRNILPALYYNGFMLSQHLSLYQWLKVIIHTLLIPSVWGVWFFAIFFTHPSSRVERRSIHSQILNYTGQGFIFDNTHESIRIIRKHLSPASLNRRKENYVVLMNSDYSHLSPAKWFYVQILIYSETGTAILNQISKTPETNLILIEYIHSLSTINQSPSPNTSTDTLSNTIKTFKTLSRNLKGNCFSLLMNDARIEYLDDIINLLSLGDPMIIECYQKLLETSPSIPKSKRFSPSTVSYNHIHKLLVHNKISIMCISKFMYSLLKSVARETKFNIKNGQPQINRSIIICCTIIHSLVSQSSYQLPSEIEIIIKERPNIKLLHIGIFLEMVLKNIEVVLAKDQRVTQSLRKLYNADDDARQHQNESTELETGDTTHESSLAAANHVQ